MTGSTGVSPLCFAGNPQPHSWWEACQQPSEYHLVDLLSSNVSKPPVNLLTPSVFVPSQDGVSRHSPSAMHWLFKPSTLSSTERSPVLVWRGLVKKSSTIAFPSPSNFYELCTYPSVNWRVFLLSTCSCHINSPQLFSVSFSVCSDFTTSFLRCRDPNCTQYTVYGRNKVLGLSSHFNWLR